jgi:hypothetical protein
MSDFVGHVNTVVRQDLHLYFRGLEPSSNPNADPEQENLVSTVVRERRLSDFKQRGSIIPITLTLKVAPREPADTGALPSAMPDPPEAKVPQVGIELVEARRTLGVLAELVDTDDENKELALDKRASKKKAGAGDKEDETESSSESESEVRRHVKVIGSMLDHIVNEEEANHKEAASAKGTVEATKTPSDVTKSPIAASKPVVSSHTLYPSSATLTADVVLGLSRPEDEILSTPQVCLGLSTSPCLSRPFYFHVLTICFFILNQ